MFEEAIAEYVSTPATVVALTHVFPLTLAAALAYGVDVPPEIVIVCSTLVCAVVSVLLFFLLFVFVLLFFVVLVILVKAAYVHWCWLCSLLVSF